MVRIWFFLEGKFCFRRRNGEEVARMLWFFRVRRRFDVFSGGVEIWFSRLMLLVLIGCTFSFGFLVLMMSRLFIACNYCY